jgi:hypothetical protein
MNEDNFIALYALGEGVLHLSGYSLRLAKEAENFAESN